MQSVGAWLKTCREKRSLSLTEISEVTKINLLFLKALEEDRFEQLPGGMFPRAMVKACARALGESEQAAVEIYSKQFPPPLPPPPDPPSHRWLPVMRFSIFLILFLLTAATGLWYLKTEWRTRSLARESNTSRRPTLATSTPVVTASMLPTTSFLEPEPSGLDLQVLVEEECWLSLSADGNIVDRRLLKKGEAFSYHAENKFEALVGNAGGIKLVVNGQEWEKLGNPYDVKKIRIDKAEGKVRVTT
ncbi:MAG TPA: helix-turn-helix domain-containing protein [Acidobacteriota bacterium]|jgi:cytoskeletal protein RodZ|nr:helix-turn-helix domain-containing protein [Acidobacteriota bacterium]